MKSLALILLIAFSVGPLVPTAYGSSVWDKMSKDREEDLKKKRGIASDPEEKAKEESTEDQAESEATDETIPKNPDADKKFESL